MFGFKQYTVDPLSVSLPRRTRREYLKYREMARAIVHTKLQHFNKHYQLPYNRVAVRNQRSRWGSCSSKRNINFNYRIVHLPPELQDYLIVHELCHLKEFNHSRAFWQLVAEQVPEYAKLRRVLKRIR